jgi:hypothetical protein
MLIFNAASLRSLRGFASFRSLRGFASLRSLRSRCSLHSLRSAGSWSISDICKRKFAVCPIAVFHSQLVLFFFSVGVIKIVK